MESVGPRGVSPFPGKVLGSSENMPGVPKKLTRVFGEILTRSPSPLARTTSEINPLDLDFGGRVFDRLDHSPVSITEVRLSESNCTGKLAEQVKDVQRSFDRSPSLSLESTENLAVALNSRFYSHSKAFECIKKGGITSSGLSLIAQKGDKWVSEFIRYANIQYKKDPEGNKVAKALIASIPAAFVDEKSLSTPEKISLFVENCVDPEIKHEMLFSFAKNQRYEQVKVLISQMNPAECSSLVSFLQEQYKKDPEADKMAHEMILMVPNILSSGGHFSSEEIGDLIAKLKDPEIKNEMLVGFAREGLIKDVLQCLQKASSTQVGRFIQSLNRESDKNSSLESMRFILKEDLIDRGLYPEAFSIRENFKMTPDPEKKLNQTELDLVRDYSLKIQGEEVSAVTIKDALMSEGKDAGSTLERSAEVKKQLSALIDNHPGVPVERFESFIHQGSIRKLGDHLTQHYGLVVNGSLKPEDLASGICNESVRMSFVHFGGEDWRLKIEADLKLVGLSDFQEVGIVRYEMLIDADGNVTVNSSLLTNSSYEDLIGRMKSEASQEAVASLSKFSPKDLEMFIRRLNLEGDGDEKLNRVRSDLKKDLTEKGRHVEALSIKQVNKTKGNDPDIEFSIEQIAADAARKQIVDVLGRRIDVNILKEEWGKTNPGKVPNENNLREICRDLLREEVRKHPEIPFSRLFQSMHQGFQAEILAKQQGYGKIMMALSPKDDGKDEGKGPCSLFYTTKIVPKGDEFVVEWDVDVRVGDFNGMLDGEVGPEKMDWYGNFRCRAEVDTEGVFTAEFTQKTKECDKDFESNR